jgi:hypothetical protein
VKNISCQVIALTCEVEKINFMQVIFLANMKYICHQIKAVWEKRKNLFLALVTLTKLTPNFPKKE